MADRKKTNKHQQNTTQKAQDRVTRNPLANTIYILYLIHFAQIVVTMVTVIGITSISSIDYLSIQHEIVIDCCLKPQMINISAIPWLEQVTIDDNDAHFVLSQHS